MQPELVQLDIPERCNIIIGQAHFIKTVDDVFEALAGAAPGIRFGIAFNEASQDRLVRHDGNDPALEEAAVRNAMALGAGHALVIVLKDAYPINVMGALKAVPELCAVYCATANPVQVITMRAGEGRAILGVADGSSPLGVEGPKEREARHRLLKDIGYRP
ncbi:adenosine-specific kinase [Candidatus Fermentibacteria bacterium]|nr:adenosine-specific kinase [Candidatus Fermentibacteria bacterium]